MADIPQAPEAPVHKQFAVSKETPTNVRLPHYWMDGLMPEGREQSIRDAIDVMQPAQSPKSVHLISPKEWSGYQTQARVGGGKFKFNHSDLGNGFSDKEGNIYLNSGVADTDLFHTIGHEFGHITKKTSNEGEADAAAEPIYKRLNAYTKQQKQQREKAEAAKRTAESTAAQTSAQASSPGPLLGQFKNGGIAKKTGKYLVHRGEMRIKPGTRFVSGRRGSRR